MIPAVIPLLNSELQFAGQPTQTWALDLQEGGNRVRGRTDNLDAMRQAVYKIIGTERYNYLIYSYNYGIELAGLYGKPLSYVCPELERRITEALLTDSRIIAVGGFEFDFPRRSVVHVKFAVQTIFGELSAERTVSC